MIMIGPYQLLVKDACAGMNSIFALSAIGIFYVYAISSGSRFHNAILLLSILPITIAANFFRVLALVLIAYYGGVDAVEGVVSRDHRRRFVRGRAGVAASHSRQVPRRRLHS